MVMTLIIKLSQEEIDRYYFLPHDRYYCELGLNDQELSEQDVETLEQEILKNSNISEIHHN